MRTVDTINDPRARADGVFVPQNSLSAGRRLRKGNLHRHRVNGFAIVKDAVILGSEHGAHRGRLAATMSWSEGCTEYSPPAEPRPANTEAKPEFAKVVTG